MGKPHIGADDPELAALVKAAYDEDVEATTGTGMSDRKAWAVIAMWAVAVTVLTAVLFVVIGLAAHAAERAALLIWTLVRIGWNIG